MKQARHLLFIMILPIGMLFFMAGHVNAGPNTFSVGDHFQVEDSFSAAVSLSNNETVNLGDYDITFPVGSRWTYAYKYPSGVDDFTVNISQITSGEYIGMLRRGDYYEYHPSDPRSSWAIYNLSEKTFTLYESNGETVDPPYVFNSEDYKQELECFNSCSVIPFPDVTPVPEAYLRIEESITVPAGTFYDILVKFSIDHGKQYPPNNTNHLYGLDTVEVPYAVTHIRWYARGIGLVKCIDINSGDGSIVHQYELESFNIPDSDDCDGGCQSQTDGGYDITSELWSKAVLQVSGSPVTLVWKEVGSDTTPSGDQVISGYFYADPDDFAYGSEYNPEVFVKVYIAANGW